MGSHEDDEHEELLRLRAEVESLRVYRAVMESAWAVHWVIDKDAIVKFSSQTQVSMGLTPFQNVGSATIYDALSEEVKPQARACIAESLTKPNVPVFVELRGRTPAGVWAEREVVAINRLDHPVLQGIVLTSTDIGPRNAARHALRAAYERHALAADASNDLIWEWDVGDDISTSTFISAYVRAETRGSADLLQHVHEGDRERVRAALHAQADGTPMDIEWRMVRDGAEPRWNRSVSSLVVDERGRKRVIGRTTDIHERKLAEIALGDSERRYRSLFASTSAAVTLRDTKTLGLLDCNDAAVRIFGARTREELFTTLPSDLALEIQPNGRTARELLLEALATAEREGSVRYEWTARRLSGELFVAQFLITKIEVGDGSVYQTIIEDVTDERMNVAALARAKEEALAGMRAKSAFLGAMSHELRSPLAGVIGMIDLLASGAVDARQKRYAELARASAHGLLSVINDVLDYSKFEAGGLEIAAEELSLQDVIDEALGVFATQAKEKDLFLFCRSEPVPRVIGDPERLRQILNNLLGNGIKFTSRGEVGVHLSVSDREQDAIMVRIQVSDTGIGIGPADLARIFVPFSNVDAPVQRGRGGTGLGLAISRELTQRMGGRLTVESDLDVGSRFTVALKMPLAHAEASRRPGATLGHALVIAGDPRQRSVIAAALAARGYSTEPADSAGSAAERLTSGRHTLVLIIDDPPRFDGRAAAAITVGRGARVIFVESLQAPLTEDETVRLQISARCPSPFWNAKVDAALRALESGGPIGDDSVARPGADASVLVVDDSAVNAEIAARVLGKAGYRVDIAETGEEAIALVGRRAYDAVLLDCRLPGIDGYETARRIRALERDGRLRGKGRLTIIAVTASVASGDVAQAIEAGMNAHVSKPFDANHLLRVLAGEARSSDVMRTAPAVTKDAPARLDLPRALARLAGDAGALQRAVERFVAQAPETFSSLSGAVARRDRPALEHGAHRLRGQALSFDAHALVESLVALEHALSKEAWPDVEDKVARAGEELSAVLKELSRPGAASIPR